MKNQITFSRSVLGVVLVTLALLSIPLIAMQFTSEVNWSTGDFIIMGVLLFCVGMLVAVALRSASPIAYRAATLVAIGTTFLMIWANLAVGLIGSGPHAGNLMYIGVVGVTFIGVYLSRFKAAGMERAMFATAGALVLVTAIALIANMQEYPGSSVGEIIGVNLFFAAPFVVSGLLYHYAALERSTAK
jgi:hypothetical protein